MDLEMSEIKGGAQRFSAIAIGDVEIDSKSNVLNKSVREDKQLSSYVIDINQRICRICHLTAKESGITSVELMELGCGCKGELEVAHSHCAEAWFKVRGNRLCEICGETAKNITGVGDDGFMDEWNENRDADTFTISSDGSRRCLHGQPLCNLLMACLIIAFVLPWFFRVNRFW